MGQQYTIRPIYRGKQAGTDGPALVRAEQWLEFLEHWGPKLACSEPWAMFLLQGCIQLHQAFIVWARRLRNKPTWTERQKEMDTSHIVKDAEERLEWFMRGKSQVALTLMPPWALFLLDVLDGAFRMMIRLAKEVKQVEEKGHLLINVNPFADMISPREAEHG